jgi:Flp pilus assembly protein TadB
MVALSMSYKMTAVVIQDLPNLFFVLCHYTTTA